MKINLENLRNAVADAQDNIDAFVKEHGVELDEARSVEFDALEKAFEVANKNLERGERQKAREAAAAAVAGAPVSTGEEKDVAKMRSEFRFTKLLRALDPTERNTTLDGLENEVVQEGQKEAREYGLKTDGAAVPSWMLSMEKQKRDLTVGTTTAGGHTVATDLGGLIEVLRPMPVVESLGATVLTGLQGNLDLPRHTTQASTAWEGENDANAETNLVFDKISLTPNRLGATMDISKQLMVQSSIDVENLVRGDFASVIAQALDTAAINGSGSGSQPLGLLGTSGIGDVVGGTNGATPDWADIVDLESEVNTDNALFGNLAYLTTPGIKGYLKQTVKESGDANYVWGLSDELNGYRAVTSTLVPSTLTKGTATTCHAIIFGNWRELIIGQWGGLDIVVDPYSKKTTGLVEITVNSWWDIALRHSQSFAAMQDALTA